MTIPCHVFISWHLARLITPNVKARRWIAWAGVVPDLDGLGLLVDSVSNRTHFYEQWHHVLGHNLVTGLVVACAAAVACRSGRVGAWTWVCFHLHMLADLLVGRGPDGSVWPLVYGWPLTRREWQWDGQWRLDAWPNTAIFIALLVWVLLVARRTTRSPLELISTQLDQKVIGAFKSVLAVRRAGKPAV